MSARDQSTVDAIDDVAPVEVVGDDKPARTPRLSDGTKAVLYILFGILLAAFIIGIWPLIEVLNAPPLPQ